VNGIQATASKGTHFELDRHFLPRTHLFLSRRHIALITIDSSLHGKHRALLVRKRVRQSPHSLTRGIDRGHKTFAARLCRRFPCSTCLLMCRACAFVVATNFYITSLAQERVAAFVVVAVVVLCDRKWLVAVARSRTSPTPLLVLNTAAFILEFAFAMSTDDASVLAFSKVCGSQYFLQR
jgi:hypothetical protein